ncbi:hypothetical protein QJQ45_004780 [Haematococcus lacustris]|nr:hypothetical protein QJQ45_004780 [Haematococcus lacustris]
MVLDINLFRADKGGDLDLIRASQRKRFADEKLVDRVAALDDQWRKAKYARDQLSKQLNAISKQLALHHKAGKNVAEDQAVARRLKTELEQANQQAGRLQAQRDSALQAVGNLVHHSVPHHRDEAHNQVISTGGPPPRTRGPEAALLGHAELLQRLDLADLEAGAAAAGSRAYFLLNEGVLLNQALIAYGLHFMTQRGWTPVQTPFWLKAEVMARCAQLSQFDEELLVSSPAKGRPPATAATPLNGGPLPAELEAEEDGSGSSRYLIATSEQALCALHQGSWLEPQDLPLRYVGLSTCFRREAGSHGKDTAGIFRVHQFDKVEQFAITAPGQPSWDMLDRMVQTAQDFYTSLQLPHRSVRVVSGALNLAAAAKVDVEAWFPASGAYRELVSASNCTDYQARRLDIRLHSAGAGVQAAVSTGIQGS